MSLVIDHKRDIIIVEKITETDKGVTALKGSKFFCGCCGKSIGTAKEDMTFPFSVDDFMNSLEDKSFTRTMFGIFHDLCQHAIQAQSNGYKFVSMKTYIETVPQT